MFLTARTGVNSDHPYSDSSETMVRVSFNPDKTDIETFVKEKAPSKTLRKDGYQWIYVRSNTRSKTRELIERYEDEDEDDANQDMDEMFAGESKLMQDWNALCKSVRSSVTYHAVCELAKANRCRSGKWLVYESPGAKLDKVWADIARATVKGNLGSAAKVRTRGDDKTQVICVYNKDFTDRDSVLNLEKGLRRLGIGTHLYYKPDVYTYLRIYAKNKWNIKSTICSSKYDFEKQQWNVRFTNEISSDEQKDKSTKTKRRKFKAAVAKNQTKLTRFMKSVHRPSTSHEGDVAHLSSQKLPYHQPRRSKRIASNKQKDESTKTKVPKV